MTNLIKIFFSDLTKAKKVKKHLPPQIKHEVVAKISNGEITAREASLEFNQSVVTIYDWIKKSGIKPARKNSSFYTLSEKLNILKQVKEGKHTTTTASDHYRVSRESIYSWRRKYKDLI